MSLLKSIFTNYRYVLTIEKQIGKNDEINTYHRLDLPYTMLDLIKVFPTLYSIQAT